MNVWMWASGGLLVSLALCGFICFRGSVVCRLVGLELGSTVLSLFLLTLAQAMHRTPFYDLSLALALLTFGAGLVFAHFLERWL